VRFVKELIRRVGRVVTWPIRRLLDPRFDDVNARIHALKEVTERQAEWVRNDVTQHTVAAAESLAHVGRELRAIQSAVDDLNARLDAREVSEEDPAGALSRPPGTP
jgi:hypothetical protein